MLFCSVLEQSFSLVIFTTEWRNSGLYTWIHRYVNAILYIIVFPLSRIRMFYLDPDALLLKLQFMGTWMWTWRVCWTGNTPFNTDFCFGSSKSGKEQQNSPWSVLQSQEKCNENYFRWATVSGLKLFLKTTRYQRLKSQNKQNEQNYWVECFLPVSTKTCVRPSHVLHERKASFSSPE